MIAPEPNIDTSRYPSRTLAHRLSSGSRTRLCKAIALQYFAIADRASNHRAMVLGGALRPLRSLWLPKAMSDQPVHESYHEAMAGTLSTINVLGIREQIGMVS